MIDLLFVGLLTAWSVFVGLAVLRRLDAAPVPPWDRLALACTLGYGILAMAALVLGELGLFQRGGFLAAMGLVLGASLWVLHRLPKPDHGDFLDASPRTPNRWTMAFDAAFLLTLVGTGLTAMTPATDGDALCYHLQVPKVFLLEGALTFEPDLHETVYPLVTEMLYAVALAFRGPIACRMIQWVLGLCFAGCVTALARPVLGSNARWAGTIAMLVPAVSNGMGAPLNDVALATFSNAALVAVMLWRDRATTGRAALAGVLAGMAIGVKYPALVWVGLLGGFMMLGPKHAKPVDRKHALRSVAVFGVAVLLTGGWWYLRAYVYTGNPVYPFFRHLFGGSGIDDVLDPIKRPLAVTLPNLITALGWMTLQPDRFDSLSHQFGPIFLLFVPGLFLFRPPRRVVELALLGFTFLTLCLTQRQSMRFVLLALGPFSVAVAWVARSLQERSSLPSRILLMGLVALLGCESLVAVARARHGLGVIVGRESEAEYLARREPTYRVGRWIEANLDRSTRLIGQEHRGYYLPRPYVMELAYRRRTKLGTRLESAKNLVAILRADGFTHVMFCPPQPENAVEFDPTLSRKLDPWLRDRSPLYRESITDPDGVPRTYSIYSLQDEPPRGDRMVRR